MSVVSKRQTEGENDVSAASGRSTNYQIVESIVKRVIDGERAEWASVSLRSKVEIDIPLLSFSQQSFWHSTLRRECFVRHRRKKSSISSRIPTIRLNGLMNQVSFVPVKILGDRNMNEWENSFTALYDFQNSRWLLSLSVKILLSECDISSSPGILGYRHNQMKHRIYSGPKCTIQ